MTPHRASISTPVLAVVSTRTEIRTPPYGTSGSLLRLGCWVVEDWFWSWEGGKEGGGGGCSAVVVVVVVVAVEEGMVAVALEEEKEEEKGEEEDK